MNDSQLVTNSVSETVSLLEPARDPLTVFIASKANGSRRAYFEALQLLGGILVAAPGKLDDPRMIPWEKLTFAETSALRAKLIERKLSPAYANKILAALRGVLRAAWRLELMGAEQYQRAIDLEPVHGAREAAGRDAQGEELARLFKSCRQDANHVRGLRDAAILSLAYGAGLRRNEIAELTIDQFDSEQRLLRVVGKGNRERYVPIAEWAAENIRGWMRERGDAPGGLICTLDNPAPLTGQSIYTAIVRCVRRAGVSKLTPHDFRRTVATELLDRTNDLVAVQKILGHASPVTTERYLKQIERQKRRAADTLPDPEAR